MSLIYNLVLFSFVLVVLVFIYYLYHSNLVNQLTKYDYETSSNPNLMNYLRNEGLLCPENYEYVKSDNDFDYCQKQNSNINCELTVQNPEGTPVSPYDDENKYQCMKYKNFERNAVTQAIEYPKNNKVTEPIKDRCIKKKHSNYCSDIVEDTDCELNSTNTGCQLPGGTSATNAQCKFNNTLWTALDPYYYSKKCQNAIRPSDTS